eukprot:6362670-Pyramimonas_sp.AAC.1
MSSNVRFQSCAKAFRRPLPRRPWPVPSACPKNLGPRALPGLHWLFLVALTINISTAVATPTAKRNAQAGAHRATGADDGV